VPGLFQAKNLINITIPKVDIPSSTEDLILRSGQIQRLPREIDPSGPVDNGPSPAVGRWPGPRAQAVAINAAK